MLWFLTNSILYAALVFICLFICIGFLSNCIISVAKVCTYILCEFVLSFYYDFIVNDFNLMLRSWELEVLKPWDRSWNLKNLEVLKSLHLVNLDDSENLAKIWDSWNLEILKSWNHGIFKSGNFKILKSWNLAHSKNPEILKIFKSLNLDTYVYISIQRTTATIISSI